MRNNFGRNVDNESITKANKVCSVMNKLQLQAFRINELFLENLLSSESQYAVEGLLMPGFLKYLNMNDAQLHKLVRELILCG